MTVHPTNGLTAATGLHVAAQKAQIGMTRLSHREAKTARRFVQGRSFKDRARMLDHCADKVAKAVVVFRERAYAKLAPAALTRRLPLFHVTLCAASLIAPVGN